jgi:glycosyltransferase involved in cell wall biosynthesis
MLALSIAHTVGSLETEAAGPSYTVPRLARALAEHGHLAEVMTLGSPGSTNDSGFLISRYARDVAFPSSLVRLGRSAAMRAALFKSEAQVFHTHGLWMMPSVYPALAAVKLERPFVLSPRGMLGESALRFSSMKKKVFWHLWQSRATQAVRCFHATALSELDDIRAFGLRQPVAVVPNGVDLPDIASLEYKSPTNVPYILSLGRIHPKKGLDRLISAFALVSRDYPQWKLRIVGPDEGRYAEELRRQVFQSHLADKVSIEGPVFGTTKFSLMQQAEVFCLPTLHENFGMTVAESLAVETPVISTKGAPWAGLIDRGCGWWVDHGPEAIARALHEAMAMSPEERLAMGFRGRRWVAQDFSWHGIGEKMAMVYLWLLGHGPKPDFVQI